MLARSTIARGLPQKIASRGMASAAAHPFHYSVGDAAGVKVASRDDNGPTTTLAVVVRGGSRYETAPGLAHGLANFAFKNTTRRSALRLQRESELLGGSFNSSLSRENIVLKAKFLRGDLPYFVEALGDVLTNSKYLSYEFNEEVAPVMVAELQNFARDPAAIALENAHNVAFHTGLGGHRLALTPKLNSSLIGSYAKQVYQKGNIAVVASGAAQADVQKWTGEFFGGLQAGNGVSSGETKYYGGENRTYSAAGNAMVIAFPGSSKAEQTVLAYLLGGEASTKWNIGTSILSQAVGQLSGVKAVARHTTYSDAGLLTITVTGPQGSLAAAGKAVVEAVNGLANVNAETVKKAINQAKFDAYAGAEDRSAGLEFVGQSLIASGKAPQTEEVVKALEAVSVESVKKAVAAILKGKATYTAVGDLHYLPFASDIGLQV